MAAHRAEVIWTRDGQDFLDHRYSRRFIMRFDGGVDVAGSASPMVVPVPFSDPAAVDPEEAFVASLSSCHMLWFLSLAAKQHFRVDRYTDSASGTMAKNAHGMQYMAAVTLRPEVEFSGDRLPMRAEIEALHHDAHRECFIANSVITDVRCEPVLTQ